MAQKYADRAYISVNGQRFSDVVSATLRQNPNAKVVPTMTRDKFNKGFVQGNTDIEIDVTIALQNKLSRPKVEAIDYENNDVQLTFECGAELFTATGLFPGPVDDSAGGVGSEVRSSFKFGALKVVDAVGNSALFNIDLT